MFDKILEIIAYLLEEYKNTKRLDKVDLDTLKSFGYTEVEINTALAWVFTKIVYGETVFKDSDKTKSIRFFNKQETRLFTPEALGYVIQLRELGLISDNDLEQLMDRVLISGYLKINLSDIKKIIVSQFMQFESNSEIKERLAFLNNETIN